MVRYCHPMERSGSVRKTKDPFEGAVYDVPIRTRGAWRTILDFAMVLVPVALIIGAVLQGGIASLLSWRILLIALIDLVIWLVSLYLGSTGTVDAEDIVDLYERMFIPVEPDTDGKGFHEAKTIVVPTKDGQYTTFRFQTGKEWDEGLTGPGHIHEAMIAVHDDMAAVMMVSGDGGEPSVS